MKTYCFIHVLKKPTRSADKYIYVVDPLSFMFQILKTVVSDYIDTSLNSLCIKTIKAICMLLPHSNVDMLQTERISPSISAAHPNFWAKYKSSVKT